MTVANNLSRIGTEEGSGAVAAAIFWLKTRAVWREVDRTVEATDGKTVTLWWATEADAAV